MNNFYRTAFFCLLSAVIALGSWEFFHSSEPASSQAVARSGKSTWRSSLEQRSIDVYKRANSAVAFISATSLHFDPFDVSGVRQSEGTGSGVIVDSTRGLLLTNLHVIENVLSSRSAKQQIRVLLADGSSHNADVIGFDEQYDLAVLRFTPVPGNLTAVPLGSSDALEVGQQVLVIGNPHGLNRTLTTGIVSSLDRSVRNPAGFLMQGLIQTDAAINPGNSGGPLLNLDGELVGINTAILSRSGDSAGIGFAVPAAQIKRVLPELIHHGSIRRPYLGWALIDTTLGPVVQRVFADSPASRARLEPLERPVKSAFLQGFIRDYDRADVIVAINGQRVDKKQDVEEVLHNLKADQLLKVTVRLGGREGAERSIELKPDWR